MNTFARQRPHFNNLNKKTQSKVLKKLQSQYGIDPNEVKEKSYVKYRNKIAYYEGFKFHSEKERDRYISLKYQERIGEIKDLVLQPKFEFIHEGKKICTYNADFSYIICQTTEKVVEDVKNINTITPVYKLKKRLMLIFFGIEVVEIL